MSPLITVEQITRPGHGTPALCTHGEGPAWDAVSGQLHWVDMDAGDVLTFEPSSGNVSRRRVGKLAAAVRPRAAGGLVLALERQFALLDTDADEPVLLEEQWADPSIRFNDGGCDRQGRFYCGSMSYRESERMPVGSLYRLDPDLTTSVVLNGVTISNGIVWTPDGTTTFYIDSVTQRVDAFDAGPNGLDRRRTIVEIPEAAGVPDGMSLDADGGLWVALWGGSAVHRYLPDGRLDAVVKLPVPLVTACTFGGPDLADLYITTSRREVESHQDSTAGALYRCRPGVTGVAETPFAG